VHASKFIRRTGGRWVTRRNYGRNYVLALLGGTEWTDTRTCESRVVVAGKRLVRPDQAAKVGIAARGTRRVAAGRGPRSSGNAGAE